MKQPDVIVTRATPLRDLDVRGSDKRTVVAYAAPFGVAYEVHDQHGDYLERNDPHAFDQTIRIRGTNVPVFYNHGMSIHGTPLSDLGSVPLGVPKVIRAEAKGLLTHTWMHESPFGDAILEAINSGAIKAYSHTSAIKRSDPAGRIPRVRGGGTLPTVTRLEYALKEYGPTPLAIAEQARVLGVRSHSAMLSANDRAAVLFDLLMASATPGDGWVPDDDLTPDDGAEVTTANGPTRGHPSRNRVAIRARIPREIYTWEPPSRGSD